MSQNDKWASHDDGSPLPLGFKRLDLPVRRVDLWHLLTARGVFYYRVFNVKYELLYVLIPENEYDFVFQRFAPSIAENQYRVALRREQLKQRQRCIEAIATGLSVREAIVSGCQAASRLNAGESRSKAMEKINAWVKFLRDAGYLSHISQSSSQREVLFVVEGVSYGYFTEMNMPQVHSMDFIPSRYRAGESCFDEDMIKLDAAIVKLQARELIEREKTIEELKLIRDAGITAKHLREEEMRFEAERLAVIRSEQRRKAKNERARIRRFEKKHGIVRPPERTKKQACEAGLHTAAYYMRQSVKRIPRCGEQPEIVRGEEFFAVTQTERLLSKTAGKGEGLILREHAVPANRYHFRKARKHYHVYRESEFIPTR